MKRLLLLIALFSSISLYAQKVAVSTNLVDYANYGTINGKMQIALGQHVSAIAGAKYNPFTFHGKEELKSRRQRTFSLGAEWWPWHVYSGWSITGVVQYQEYNEGGIKSARTYEGDRVGVGVAGAYSYMLHKNLNLLFGAGLWGGYDWYTAYSCPVCGLTEGSGEKYFILPNDITIGLSYVF